MLLYCMISSPLPLMKESITQERRQSSAGMTFSGDPAILETPLPTSFYPP